mgnify:CR=1 FL=1
MNQNQGITMENLINSDGFKKGQTILYGKTPEQKLEICKMYCQQVGIDFTKIYQQAQEILGTTF